MRFGSLRLKPYDSGALVPYIDPAIISRRLKGSREAKILRPLGSVCLGMHLQLLHILFF